MTLNKDKVNNFWKSRTKVKDPRIATHYKKDNSEYYDLNLITKYSKIGQKVLDLGCGTCVISNKLAEKGYEVTAVDKHKEFLEHANISEYLVTKQSDIIDYTDTNLYSLILLFGVANFLTDQELLNIYNFAYTHLLPGGVFIAKHQCGISQDILVDSFSKEVGDNYHALYRHWNREKLLLSDIFTQVTIIDIYPENLNKWNNTHFYAFICNK